MGLKKKLCIILPQHWSYQIGGSQYQIKCLLDEDFFNSEFDVFIISRRIDSDYSPKNYRLVSIVKPHPLQRYGRIFDAPFLWQKLKAISPDVIYQNIGTSYAGVAAMFARKYKRKLVLHIASDIDVVPFDKKIGIKTIIPLVEKKALDYAIHHADHLIAQTPAQRHLIRQHYNREADVVIPNFQPIPKETRQKNAPIKIVWIANFKPLKQPELFIRLAEELSHFEPAAEFIMIGNPDKANAGQWQQSLEKRIERIPSLTYLGGRTVDEVNQILSGVHILVNTSIYEGFSNTFIQAWMRGVPVVSLNSNPDSLLDGGQLGFCSGNYSRLRNHVLQLIENTPFREQMGQHAQTFAMEHFSMNNANRILKLMAN